MTENPPNIKMKFGGVSTIEIDARLFELQRQREAASNQAVMYAGQLAELKDENATLRQANGEVQKRLAEIELELEKLKGSAALP